MTTIRAKFKAVCIHVAISLVMGVAVAWLVFMVWCPYPYKYLSSGENLFLIILGIDVVAGPLLTGVVFNPRKKILERMTDISVIAILQIAALSYGIWSIFSARPIHVVFEYDRFRIVHANEVQIQKGSNTLRSIEASFRQGPTWLALRPLSANESFDLTSQALGGIPLAAQSELWEPYCEQILAILKASKPIHELLRKFPDQKNLTTDAVASAEQKNLRFLPIQGRKGNAWTALISGNSGLPIGFSEVDAFEVP